MKFATDLRVQRLDDGKWKLVAPITYYNLPGHDQITVPCGFVTDFASVPRLPFMFWFLGDRADYAAVLHDYLYQTGRVSRAEADALFRAVAEMEGVNWPSRWAMWLGIRAGGWLHYAERHEANSET